MKTTKTFTEAETRALISKAIGVPCVVRFNVSERRDYYDRPTGGYDVELEVEVNEPFPLETPK